LHDTSNEVCLKALHQNESRVYKGKITTYLLSLNNNITEKEKKKVGI